MRDCKRDDTTVSSSNAAHTANWPSKCATCPTYTPTLTLSDAVYKCSKSTRYSTFEVRPAVCIVELVETCRWLSFVCTGYRMALSMR
jgi:hypothetical protein